MNPVYLTSSSDACGLHIMMFVGALVSSCTEGSRGLSVTSMARNALLAYYLLLANLAQLQAKHGKAWSSKFLPLCTIRSIAKTLACALLICKSAANIGCAHCFAEKQLSELKRDYTGKPSIKDAILSTQKSHLQQMKWKLPPPSSSACNNVSDEELRKIAAQALQNASRFLSWVTRGKRPQDIRETLFNWWKGGGCDVLARGSEEECDLDPLIEGDAWLKLLCASDIGKKVRSCL